MILSFMRELQRSNCRLVISIYNLQLLDLLQKGDRFQIALQDAAQIDSHQPLGFIACRGRNGESLDRFQRLRLQKAQQLKCAQADWQRRAISQRTAWAERAAGLGAEALRFLGQRLLTHSAMIQVWPIAYEAKQPQLVKSQRQIQI